jgi:RHS repeat-associated protein
MVEVYFDDFKVTQVKSPVIASNDYYPFGLQFNSYSRENSLEQKYLYNGKEKQDALGLDWFDYGARMYQPDLGRWMVVDPKANKYYGLSPYNYVANIPTRLVDPNGMEIDWDVKDRRERREIRREIRELRRSSETFNTEWKQLKKSENTYTITANKNVNAYLKMDNSAGKFIEGPKGGNILINTEVLGKNNKGAILQQTVAEEATHAVQSDNGSLAGDLNKEFEAKAITGVILNEAGLYKKADKSAVDITPFMFGNGLSQGTNKISEYNNFFSVFLGIVDNTGGYNGKTTESFGAVTDDGPELLKKLIKQ